MSSTDRVEKPGSIVGSRGSIKSRVCCNHGTNVSSILNRQYVSANGSLPVRCSLIAPHWLAEHLSPKPRKPPSKHFACIAELLIR